MSSVPTLTGSNKPGSLTIAGSGISSIAHMTLQTVTALEGAERVYYWVNDPVTEAFIQEKNENSVNLGIYCELGKSLHETYVQMAEVMLRDVRAGSNILGLFFGHPGFFLAPTHRALTIARAEGYEARMLPGVSTFDCILADLEFEPAYSSCVVHEAAQLIARGKTLDSFMHHVILQITMSSFPTTEDRSRPFQLLVQHLMRSFEPEHKVVLYTAGILPQTCSTMEVYTLENLLNPELVKQIHGRSCLHIPPLSITRPESHYMTMLDSNRPLLESDPRWVGPRFVEAANYGPHEILFVDRLSHHMIPEAHRSLRATPAMRRFMIELATEPAKLQNYNENRESMISEVHGLTESESTALTLGTEGPIGAVMLRNTDTEPTPAALRSIIQWIWDWLFPVAPVPY